MLLLSTLGLHSLPKQHQASSIKFHLDFVAWCKVQGAMFIYSTRPHTMVFISDMLLHELDIAVGWILQTVCVPSHATADRR